MTPSRTTWFAREASTCATPDGTNASRLRSLGPGLSELSAEAAMLSGQSASWAWPAAHRRDRGHDRLPPQDGHTRGAAAVSTSQPGHRVLPRLDQKQAGFSPIPSPPPRQSADRDALGMPQLQLPTMDSLTQTSGRTRYHLASVPWRTPTSPHRFNSINPRCSTFCISAAQPPLETVFFTASVAKVGDSCRAEPPTFDLGRTHSLIGTARLPPTLGGAKKNCDRRPCLPTLPKT
jgi:hypothetical protein